jgi:hypothetical protein
VVGWTVAAVLEEQLVERVGDDTGLVLEHLGSSGGRRHAEYWSTGGPQLSDCGAECRGLARAGGTDDENELLVAGDSGRCVGLGDVEIDVGEVDCCRLDVTAKGEAMLGPIEQIMLLVEDGLGRQRPIDSRLGDWAAVCSQERAGWDGRRDVDAAAGRHDPSRRGGRARRRHAGASMPRSVARRPPSSRWSSVGRHVDCRSLIAAIARSIKQPAVSC